MWISSLFAAIMKGFDFWKSVFSVCYGAISYHSLLPLPILDIWAILTVHASMKLMVWTLRDKVLYLNPSSLDYPASAYEIVVAE